MRHGLPSKIPRSVPLFEQFVRRETKFRIMTHKMNLKNSFKKTYINEDVTLLQAKLGRAPRQRSDVKYVIMCYEKVFITMSYDKAQTFNNLFDIREWDMEFVDSVFSEIEHFR